VSDLAIAFPWFVRSRLDDAYRGKRSIR